MQGAPRRPRGGGDPPGRQAGEHRPHHRSWARRTWSSCSTSASLRSPPVTRMASEPEPEPRRISHRKSCPGCRSITAATSTRSAVWRSRCSVVGVRSTTKTRSRFSCARWGRTPPALRNLVEVAPQLEATVLRCLRKNPNSRYDSMAELEAALCEAQIAMGCATDWDDLPPPEVDQAWKDRLARLMPGPGARRNRRSLAPDRSRGRACGLWRLRTHLLRAQARRQRRRVGGDRCAGHRGASRRGQGVLRVSAARRSGAPHRVLGGPAARGACEQRSARGRHRAARRVRGHARATRG